MMNFNMDGFSAIPPVTTATLYQSHRNMLPKFSSIPPQPQPDTGDDMACQSDDESGIIRALAMSATENETPATTARMNEALKLRQKMHPSTRRTIPVLSPRHTPSMFDDNEEEADEADEAVADEKRGSENAEPNLTDRVDVRGEARRGRIGRGRVGRSALMARLNLKNDEPRKEEKKMTSSQFQNQLSSRFKTTKHQVRKLASSDTEE